MSEKNQIVYDEANDQYRLERASNPVKAIKAADRDMKAYLKKEYQIIFPSYNEKQHFIQKTLCGNDEYLILHEKKENNGEAESEFPPPGFYQFANDLSGLYLKPIAHRQPDRHLNLRPAMEQLLEEIHTFFNKKEAFKKQGMDTSRGTLLYGPPGNGKTHTMLRAAKTCVSERNGYVFLSDPYDTKFSDITDFRDLFAEHPTLFLLEEITEAAKRKTEKLLNFLDGEYSWPYNYSIATTNYPGDLPYNIVDRPGRFDRIMPVRNPDREQRQMYLEHGLDSERVPKRLLDKTDGYSLAYLRELVVQMTIYHRSIDDVLERFQKKKRRIREAFRQPDEQLGFLATTSENGT